MVARPSVFDDTNPTIDSDVDFILYAGTRDDKYIARHVTNPVTFGPMAPPDKALLYGAVIEALELLCVKEAGLVPIRRVQAADADKLA